MKTVCLLEIRKTYVSLNAVDHLISFNSRWRKMRHTTVIKHVHKIVIVKKETTFLNRMWLGYQ